RVAAGLADRCEELDRPLPLLDGWPGLADEGVQVACKGGQELLEARVRCLAEAVLDGLGGGVLVEVHEMPPIHKLWITSPRSGLCHLRLGPGARERGAPAGDSRWRRAGVGV